MNARRTHRESNGVSGGGRSEIHITSQEETAQCALRATGVKVTRPQKSKY